MSPSGSSGPAGRGVGGSGPSSRGSGRGKPRVFAFIRQDAQVSNVVVVGTLHVCSFDAYVLFDLGSTYSYVSLYFASHFGKQPVMLDHSFWVSTPMGETLNVQLMFPSYIVSVNGVDTLANLMLLEIVVTP